LNEHFFQIETYSQNPDGRLTIQIPSQSIEDNAAIAVASPKHGKVAADKFAYQNDGFLVKVKSVEAASRGDSKFGRLPLNRKTSRMSSHF
jgi:hypothetical protein